MKWKLKHNITYDRPRFIGQNVEKLKNNVKKKRRRENECGGNKNVQID